MTAIYDLQEAARNIRHAKHNQSRKMTELLLPDLKPTSKLGALNKKSKEKLKSIEQNFINRQSQKRIEATSEYDTPQKLWKIQKFKEVQGRVDTMSAVRQGSDHSRSPQERSKDRLDTMKEEYRDFERQLYRERKEAEKQFILKKTPNLPLRKNVYVSEMQSYELPEIGSGIQSTNAVPRGIKQVLSKECLDKLNRNNSNRSNLDNFLSQPTKGFERSPVKKYVHKSNFRGSGHAEYHPPRESIIFEEKGDPTFNARASSLDATAPQVKRLHHPDVLNRSVIDPHQPLESVEQSYQLLNSYNPSQVDLRIPTQPSQPYLMEPTSSAQMLSNQMKIIDQNGPRFKQHAAVPPIPGTSTPEAYFTIDLTQSPSFEEQYIHPSLKTEENRAERAGSFNRASEITFDRLEGNLAQPKSMVYSNQKRKIMPNRMNLIARQDESTKEETASRSRNLLDRGSFTDQNKHAQGKPLRTEEDRNRIISEFIEKQRLRSKTKRNLIKENMFKVIFPKDKPQGLKGVPQEQSPLNANFAKVPQYLKKFHQEEAQNQIRRQQIERLKDVSPGTRLVGEQERLEILKDLYTTRREIKNQLERMPVRSIHIARARGTEEQLEFLEQQLVRVNNALIQFERPPVYIKL